MAFDTSKSESMVGVLLSPFAAQPQKSGVPPAAELSRRVRQHKRSRKAQPVSRPVSLRQLKNIPQVFHFCPVYHCKWNRVSCQVLFHIPPGPFRNFRDSAQKCVLFYTDASQSGELPTTPEHCFFNQNMPYPPPDRPAGASGFRCGAEGSEYAPVERSESELRPTAAGPAPRPPAAERPSDPLC